MPTLVNWQTSLTGAAAIAAAVAHLLGALSHGDTSSIMADFAGMAAGLGLLRAKDQNVTGGSVKQ